jgi:hypothetical protein
VRSWIDSIYKVNLRFYFGPFQPRKKHTENTEKSFFSVFSVRFSSVACVPSCCIELRSPGSISNREGHFLSSSSWALRKQSIAFSFWFMLL